MKNILNSYAVKSFSEHPTAIWPLDDDAFFLSLIPSTTRQFTNWTKTNATAIEEIDVGFTYPETLSPFSGEESYSTLQASVPAAVTITNAVGNGTTVTYTTSAAHGLTTNQVISITGIAPAQYALASVLVASTPTATTFTVTSNVTGTYTSGGTVQYAMTMQAVTSNLFYFADLNTEKASFCLNTYIFQNSVYVNWYEIGYIYNDGSDHEVVHRVYDGQNGSWINFNFTFPLPTGSPTNFRLVFRVNVNTGGVNSDYQFTMNALSVGQWSETTCSRSVGSTAVSLPVASGVTGYGIPADQYGILSNNAYYVVEGEILARNDSSPMIFGTDSLTRVVHSPTGKPSIIFPAYGMLNTNGRYKKHTLEMWLKIRPNTLQSRRILGPISGDYGVYVRDNHISLVVGNNVGSHFVSTWYRPMLLHVVFNTDYVSLFINGERVITVAIDRKTISLPDSLADVSPDPDWWGVYSYTDIEKFDIDCISIYPYVMSESVAKKRFVWGQGTPSITSINNQYLGTSTYVDYSNANYAVNAVYPDAYAWGNGFFNNVVASKASLSTPNYSLPDVYIGGRREDDWYSVNQVINDTEHSLDGTTANFVTFRPNQVTRRNLMGNPAMETSGFYGVQSSTLAYLTTGGYSSSKCLEVTITTGSITTAGTNLFANAAANVRTAVTPGDSVTVSAYVKVPAGQPTITARFRRTYYTATSGGSVVGSASTSPTTSVAVANGWTRISWTMTVPASANAVVYRIENSTSSTNGQKFLVDAVLIEKSAELGYYFDGDSQYGTWTGTAHASEATVPAWSSTGTNWNEKCYFYFDTMNVLTDPVSAFYGVFAVGENLAVERPLFFLKNVVSKDTFSIILSGMTVQYKINSRVLHSYTINIDEHFVVGVNIQALAAYYGNEILDFFGASSYVQMYVGGDGIDTFEGKIFRVGFSNNYNFQEIEQNFLNNGTAVRADDGIFTEHYASYTMMVLNKYNRFHLDISVSSQWEEYYPLTHFAKYVTDMNGKSYYDLDMLQINVGYSHPYSVVGDEIDITNSPLKTYLTFQSVVDGANDPISAFTLTQKLPTSKVIDANLNADYTAYSTKFEFVDNTVVIPPKTININDIAMTVYFDLKQEGILTSPINIKNFEISSMVFDNNNFSQIGTRYGSFMYPYSKDGFYYSAKNPGAFSIYKRNTPYLYMTNDSGIKMIEPATETHENAISIPINKNESSSVTIGAVQMWMMHELDFSTSAIKLFEINGKTQTLEFMVVADASGQRGIVYARDKTTRSTVYNLKYYQNGTLVNNPIIQKGEWNSLGISFDDTVDMESYAGAINLFGGTVFNNISHYLSTGLGRNENTISRPWIKVLLDTAVYDNGSDPANATYFNASTGYIKWNYWYQVNPENAALKNTWAQVYLVNQDPTYVVTPEDIYAAFTGTNINIVDDDRGVTIMNDKLMSITDIAWSTTTEIPA